MPHVRDQLCDKGHLLQDIDCVRNWAYELRPMNWRLLAAYDEFNLSLLYDSLEAVDNICNFYRLIPTQRLYEAVVRGGEMVELFDYLDVRCEQGCMPAPTERRAHQDYTLDYAFGVPNEKVTVF